MSSIRDSLHTAIKRANATSPDARNRIYTAARDAIPRLPDEHSEYAMTQLIEAVKDIETEFAQHELDASSGLESSANNNQPPPDNTSPVGNQDETLQIKDHTRENDDLPHRNFPWLPVAMGTGLLIIMGFSLYLLFKRF